MNNSIEIINKATGNPNTSKYKDDVTFDECLEALRLQQEMFKTEILTELKKLSDKSLENVTAFRTIGSKEPEWLSTGEVVGFGFVKEFIEKLFDDNSIIGG